MDRSAQISTTGHPKLLQNTVVPSTGYSCTIGSNQWSKVGTDGHYVILPTVDNGGQSTASPADRPPQLNGGVAVAPLNVG